MLIGGINTLTLLDYPGKVSCIIFTAGCPFRCGFCHNPQFVLPERIKELAPHFIPEEKFFHFLDSRKEFLDGVVISGGEPTMQPDLIPFLKKIKKKGLLIKLDTMGINPDVLKKILEEKLVDYIAMDIKNPIVKYSELVGVPVDTKKIIRSRDLILSSKIDHEFRTTVIDEIHDEDDIKSIVEFCRGAKKYSIQNFRNTRTLDEKFQKFHGCSAKKLEKFKKIAEKEIDQVEILN